MFWQTRKSVINVTLSGFPPPKQHVISGLDYLTNCSVSVVANNARGIGYSSFPIIASTTATGECSLAHTLGQKAQCCLVPHHFYLINQPYYAIAVLHIVRLLYSYLPKNVYVFVKSCIAFCVLVILSFSKHTAVPSSPVNITVKKLGSTSAFISWVVSDDGGSPIIGARITYRAQNSRLTMANVLGSILEYQLSDLPFNSSQTISLSVFNGVGTGQETAFTFSTTGVPEAPPYLVALAYWGMATVCWPTLTSGQPYLLYRVRVQRVGSALGGDVVVDLEPYSATQSYGTTCIQVWLICHFQKCKKYEVILSAVVLCFVCALCVMLCVCVCYAVCVCVMCADCSIAI